VGGAGGDRGDGGPAVRGLDDPGAGRQGEEMRDVGPCEVDVENPDLAGGGGEREGEGELEGCTGFADAAFAREDLGKVSIRVK